MVTVSGGATLLRLDTGAEVRALVQVGSGVGDRKRCLFLHGNPGSSADWSRVVPLLAGRFDTAAIDLPGFGQSPRPDSSPGCLSLDRLADHAVGAADALAWREPFFLVGHSHGGGVAQVASVRHPERIAGIVLIGTLGAPAQLSYRLLSLPGASAVVGMAGHLFRRPSLHAVSRAVVHNVMRGIFSPEPVPAERADRELSQLAARPEILSSMVDVTRGRPSDQLLRSAAQIRCPTLFLHGERDALVPARFARSIHERIVSSGGRSTFHLVAGAGHMLVEFQAAEVATHIASFMDR